MGSLVPTSLNPSRYIPLELYILVQVFIFTIYLFFWTCIQRWGGNTIVSFMLYIIMVLPVLCLLVLAQYHPYMPLYTMCFSCQVTFLHFCTTETYLNYHSDDTQRQHYVTACLSDCSLLLLLPHTTLSVP